MLRSEEISTLVQLICQCESRSLEELKVALIRSFNKTEPFYVAFALYNMVQDNILLQAQKIGVLGILCDMYGVKFGANNPFIRVLLDMALESPDPSERLLLSILLTQQNQSGIETIMKKSISTLVEELQAENASGLLNSLSPAVRELRNTLISVTTLSIPQYGCQQGVRPVLSTIQGNASHQTKRVDAIRKLLSSSSKSTTSENVSTEFDDPCISWTSSDDCISLDVGLSSSDQTDDVLHRDGLVTLSLAPSYQPSFVHLPPPLTPVTDGEILWSVDSCSSALLLDPSIGNSDIICISLLDKALSQPLTQQEAQEFSSALRTNPNLVFRIRLSSQKLPFLVESNPVTAIECLLHLSKNSDLFGEHLSALVHMDMSLHCMEVVNRLTTTISLPREFIHLYVSNCISGCENMKDKFMQNRLVRLVCVFLQSLIRNGVIQVADLLAEIQAFCVEFSKIKEANALYRLIKQEF